MAGVAAVVPAFAAETPSLSSLQYVWGVAADSTDGCPRLPEPWRGDCQRAADGLRKVVLICAGDPESAPGCVQRARRAAELGDALKRAVIAIDGANTVCAVRKTPPGRCVDLEYSRGSLASIQRDIAQLGADE
jgi:hypothetical protein